MNRLFFILWVTVLASISLWLIGCVGVRQGISVDENPRLVWPSPPDRPRIEFVRAVARPEDLGINRSFFDRLLGLFAGQKLRRMIRPYGIVYHEGKLFVADPSARLVHVFNLDSNKYWQIKGPAEGFRSPIGLAMSNKGDLFVSDSAAGKVFCFDRQGKLKAVFGHRRLIRPTGIAVDSLRQRLYVLDSASHELVALDLSGKEIFRWGGRGTEPGRFNYPAHIFLDGKGVIYVTDTMNFRIQLFNPQGKLLGFFGRHGDGMGEFSHPKGVAVDSRGHIYVVDSMFDAVQIFNREGKLLLSFGAPGHEPGELWLPTGIYIDSRDYIYVADSYNQRVQIFKFLREGQP
ncbi:MAG: 6-bladed beta-propeller [Thermodesulfobacteriota bacterium]